MSTEILNILEHSCLEHSLIHRWTSCMPEFQLKFGGEPAARFRKQPFWWIRLKSMSWNLPMALLSLNIHCRMRLCIYTASVCMRDHYSISVYDRRHSGAAQRMSLHRIELRVFYVYFMYCIQPPPPLSLLFLFCIMFELWARAWNKLEWITNRLWIVSQIRLCCVFCLAVRWQVH